jgi:Protein of unknown function (DUF2752)
MISSTHNRIATTTRVLAPPALLVAVAGVLLRFPPAHSAFYPQCPIYTAFHLACPGCGGTRALAALLHGSLTEALHLNALITLSLPLALAYGMVCYWRLLQAKTYRWPQPPPAAIYAATAITVLFAIFRNLPQRWL